MQEHPFRLQAALQNGLPPDEEVVRNNPFCLGMYNMIPIKDVGAKFPELPARKITGETITFPFPQLFIEDRARVLLGETTVKTVASNWALTARTPKRADAETSNCVPIAGGPWHFSAFHDMWFATNGTTLLMYLPGHSANYLGSTSVVPSTLCQSGSRLILAGVSGSFLSGSRWTELFDHWKGVSGNASIVRDGMTVDSAWVLWSERGGGAKDIPFVPSLAAVGVFGDTIFDDLKEVIYSRIESGELGLIPLGLPDTPLAVRRIGTGFAAFTKTGAVRFYNENGQYSYMRRADIGLMSRGAIAGTEFEIVYINANGELGRMTHEGGNAQIARYESYLKYMDATKVVISRDPIHGYYWITDGNTAYILTASGLGGPIEIYPTSIGYDTTDGLVGICAAYSSTYQAKIIGPEFDVGTQSGKRICALEATTRNVTKAGFKLRFRDRQNQTHRTTPRIPCNPNGVAFCTVSCIDAAIEFEGTVTVATQPATIEKLEAKYQSDDLRFRRGTAAQVEEA